MDESTAFATKAELEQVKKEQTRMSIKLESHSPALVDLTRDLADLSERTERIVAKVDALEAKVDALEAKVDALEAKVDALDAKVDALDAKMDRRFDTLTSVILSMGKKV